MIVDLWWITQFPFEHIPHNTVDAPLCTHQKCPDITTDFLPSSFSSLFQTTLWELKEDYGEKKCAHKYRYSEKWKGASSNLLYSLK